MDYPVLNQAPDIVQGVVPGYLDGDGKFVPASAANPNPVTGTVTVTTSGYPPLKVAASQTDYTLQTSVGALGDRIESITIRPVTTSPGAVSIKDGGGTAITLFTGGASSVGDLSPRPIYLNWVSIVGAWTMTTGANVEVLVSGDFS